jgi:predicted metal-dependent enzyme (double-stranded beta helix superfamily)
VSDAAKSTYEQLKDARALVRALAGTVEWCPHVFHEASEHTAQYHLTSVTERTRCCSVCGLTQRQVETSHDGRCTNWKDA